MSEEWRDIPGWEGLYQVSTLGRVRSLDRYRNNHHNSKAKIFGKVLKPVKPDQGYSWVTLQRNGAKKIKLVHRLVAETFLPNHEDSDVVNHKDYDSTNNKVCNLEWMTQKENVNYSRRHMSEARRKSKGKPIIGINGITGNILEFECMKDAKKYGFSDSLICSCCKGKRKAHKGYTWFYRIR